MVAVERASVAGRRLRFVALGGSIVSDWDNPVATSARAVLDAIAKAGHEVTFLEQRGNPHLSALLAHRGSRAYKAFLERYPAIRLRTYDLPRGWQRTVWFGSEIGTADAVIALPGTPMELIPEIAATPPEHVVALIDESFEIADRFRLVRSRAETARGDFAFGPAVTIAAPDERVRSRRPLLVAYDDAEAALRLANVMTGESPVLIVTGTADLPDWTYVPEIELPDHYARPRAAFVVGAGDSQWANARHLLPRGHGCASIVERKVVPAGSIDNRDDAAIQAAAIIAGVRGAMIGRERQGRA